MDEDAKYSLNYEFSGRITIADKNSVAALIKNVLQPGNPFNLEQPKCIMNIATSAILEKDEEDFLMHCNSLGKAARNEFYKSCLKDKKIQLLKTSLKTKKNTKKKSKKKNMKHLDFYVILTMLACEISISKFPWAMKFHLHVFILQKEV